MFNFFFKNKTVTIPESRLNEELATRANLSYQGIGLLPDPDEVLRKNGIDITTYNELFIDSHLSSVWEQRVSGTLSMQNSFTQNDVDEKVMQFLEEQLRRLDLDSIIHEILLAKFYGYTVFEKLWIKDGKNIFLDNLISKPREWFAFDFNNRKMLRSRNALIGMEIDDFQFEFIQNRPTYLNPYGERLASKVFWNITFKRGGIKFWVKFTEKYGMPFIEAITDISDNTKKQELLNKLISMSQDFVAVVPKGTELKVHTQATNSSSGDNYMKLAEFCDKQVSKAILTQTLTTEQGNVGSQALGNVHLGQFDKLIQSDKRFVEKALNKIFKEIVSYNFQDVIVPKWELFTDSEITETMVKVDDVLAKHLDFTKEYWVNKYGINEDEFEVKSSPEILKKDENFAEFDSIDKLSELILSEPKKLNRIMEKKIKPVLDLINESNSYTEVKEKLRTLTNLPDGDLEKLLTKTILIAEHLGISDAENE